MSSRLHRLSVRQQALQLLQGRLRSKQADGPVRRNYDSELLGTRQRRTKVSILQGRLHGRGHGWQGMCQLLDRRQHVHQVYLARTARKAYESEVRQVQVSALCERIYIGSQDRLLQGLSAALRILLDGRHLLYLQPRLLCRWRQVQQDRNQRLLQSSHQHGVLRLREFVLLDARSSKLRQVSRLLLDVPRAERSRLRRMRHQQAANPWTVLRQKRPFEDRMCRPVSCIRQKWTAVRRKPIH